MSFSLPPTPAGCSSWVEEGADVGGQVCPLVPPIDGARAMPDCWDCVLLPGSEAWSVDAAPASPVPSPGGIPAAAADRVLSPPLGPVPSSPLAVSPSLDAAVGLGGVEGLVGGAVDALDTAPGGLSRRLFVAPAVPLLPRPLPLAPPAAPPAPSLRRSSRLEGKPKMPTMDKATRILNLKMGIDTSGEMPLALARKQFEASFQSSLSESTVQGLNILLKLNLPSMVAATDALVEMAGSGGTEFAPSADQEVVV